MNRFFSSTPLWQNTGLALVRVTLGLFLVYHGWEIFDTAKMNEYMSWDMFKNSSSMSVMVYMGKAAELVSGILFIVGFVTRLASLILICTMLYITFFVGNGKIWYEDQYPFLFVLLGFVFLFTGAGKLSMDHLLFNKNQRR
ncbi:MAG TPA: DoxX family protein [Chitinophagaceae bacterium]|nr:DoxX family protein [Chitinophagaceae bacterium]